MKTYQIILFMLFSYATNAQHTNVIEIRIDNRNDDVEELQNGKIWKTNEDLDLCFDDYVSEAQGLVGQQFIGLRFQNVTIPAQAKLMNAYIQFTADETSSGAAEMLIRADNIGHSPPFSHEIKDVSNRSMTPNYVLWNPPAWEAEGASGTNQRTPDLGALIQSIVDRRDWRLGNSMTFIFSSLDKYRRIAKSFDGSTEEAPILHLEYTTEQFTAQSFLPAPQSDRYGADPHAYPVRVFPNPVRTGIFTASIEVERSADVYLEVMDELGSRVVIYRLQPSEIREVRFETAQWLPGIYLVRAWTTEKLLGTQRLVVLQ